MIISSLFLVWLGLAHPPGIAQVSRITHEREEIERVGETPESRLASQLQFASLNVGWLQAEGALWRTDNGGRTWINVTPRSVGNLASGSPADLFIDVVDYAFTSVDVGWARTSAGIFRTFDSGITWTALSPPIEIQHPAGIPFATCFRSSGGEGWIGGGQYRRAPRGEVYFDNSAVDQTSGPLKVLRPAVFKTIDGGATWQQQRIDSDEYRVHRILFVTTKQGLAFTEKSVYWTDSGGQQWHRSRITMGRSDYRQFIDARIADVFMLDHQEGWLLFRDSHLFRTVDGGRTWVAVSARSPRLPQQVPTSKLHFVSVSKGLGLDRSQGVLYRTVDGGRQWNRLALEGRVAGFFVLDGDHAWLILDRVLFRFKP